jgi:TolB-like protein/Tfp pilus assembly protein PilF
MTKPSFFAELKRRNVLRAGALYIGAAWALSQGLAQLLPVFDIPNWVTRWFVIATVIGFPFALLFSWFYEFTPEGLKRESEIDPADSITQHTGKKLDRWIIAVLALAVVLLLTNQFVLHKDTNEVASAPDKSIAVLPLTNESGDKDQQYFSDGLSENFIVALSQFSGLKVIGRNSAFQFRDSKDDSKTIGAKLDVATLLEGSVQRAGDAVRISAELIRVVDGSTIWTQSYDRPYKDLFALQDEITQSVAGALKTKLLTNDTAATQTDRPPSGNLDAYSAYLQGKFFFARGSEADLRKAIEQYATATRLDPRYALAWAASSHAGIWLAGAFLAGAEGQRVNAQARQAANTALMLEPNLAAAHSAHGEVLSAVDFDWNGAEAEFRRALQLAPNNNEAMENLGILLAERGRPEQAIELTRRSLATDPLRTTGYLLLCRYLASLGRLDEAEQAIRKAIELQPASGIFNATLVEIEIQRGDANAALATAERTLPGIWQDYALAMARQIGNDRAAANAALELTIDKHADGMAFQIAEIQALRRDPDQTFAWLDRAWTNRDPGIQFLLVNPFILRYRDDPRFAAFCNKIGLPSTTTAKALP